MFKIQWEDRVSNEDLYKRFRFRKWSEKIKERRMRWYKKGDTGDIKNYRPISLLPLLSMLQRMLEDLDSHQPRGQAGFRSGFFTIDHIHTIGQIQEKAK